MLRMLKIKGSKNKQLLTYKKWNTLKKSIIAAILLVALLAANTSTIHADSGPPWALNINNLSYTEQEGWKKLDTDVSVTSDTDDFTNGYVEVYITDTTGADSLRLVSGGSLSVSGDAVYWGDDRIGSIDKAYDGSDGRLRINFSAVAPLKNANFETGDLTGWTVDDTVNQMEGQDWAEGPDALGHEADSDPTHDDQISGSNVASVIGAAAQEGSYGLKLEISGGGLAMDTERDTLHQ